MPRCDAAARRQEFLETLGLDEPGLDRLIRAGYKLLDLVTYLHRGSEGSARLDRRNRGDRAGRPA